MRSTFEELPHMSADAARGAGDLITELPRLSLDQIALALNCSKRHLHNAFNDEQTTLATYIQDLRLGACLRELQQQGPNARPITDIALHWGFNSPSHFSRIFREHTGQSPSEFRQAVKD